MKRIILSILFLLVTLPILAQQRILEKVDESNLYEYKVFNSEGDLHQKGFYKKQNGTFIEHGIWRDNVGTKALYENGDLVWIKPKGDRKYTFREIQLHRLMRKVEMLEQKLTSL
jgi:hypothetical protein